MIMAPHKQRGAVFLFSISVKCLYIASHAAYVNSQNGFPNAVSLLSDGGICQPVYRVIFQSKVVNRFISTLALFLA